VDLLPVRLGDFRWLSRARRADLVFNLCEGINGHAKYEDLVVGTLELTGVPFTGCRTWPTTVCHRKHVANTLLAAAGLPVPAFALAQANKTPAEFPLPAIVKPSAEDASVGIDNGAVCTSKRALKKRVAQMLEQFEEVLVQEYVAGREFNVGFVGRRMLPIAEIRFEGMPDGTWPIVSYAAKWLPGSPEDEGTVPVCPADIPDDLATRIASVARDAWLHMSGGEGYGRVDIRVTDDGQPYVLEVNPGPDLSSNAGLARMGRAFGWSYDDLVMQVVDEALMRSQSHSAAAALVSGVSAA
jgi:D-alanine-D-alanine ligase